MRLRPAQDETANRFSGWAHDSERDVKHVYAAGTLVLILTVFALIYFDQVGSAILPAPSATEALLVDDLFFTQMQMIAVLFAVVLGPLGYALVAFRRRADDDTDGPHITGHTNAEVLWTLAPLALVVYFSVIAGGLLWDITAPEEDEVVVEVIGRQWSFEYRYPTAEDGETFSSAELVLPLGRQARLEVTSADVIHSFWVPEFRLKQDAVPGQVHPLRITPNRVGTYVARCAEVCGSAGDTGHTYMFGTVRVVEEDDYASWFAEQVALLRDPHSPARGAAVAEAAGCIACHNVDPATPDKVIVGPSWIGVFGAERETADGDTLVADEDYIRASILRPNEEVAAGFDPDVMPKTYEDTLSEDQIVAIIAYIESLGE